MSPVFDITVVDTLPKQAGDSPPVAVDLLATAAIRSVYFSWSLDVSILPYYWQYRISIAGGAYGAWIDTLTPFALRSLTQAELAASGLNANIAIQVRSTDDGSSNFSSTETANANCLALNAGGGDIVNLAITIADLATAVTDKMFSDSTKDGAELKALSVRLTELASAVTDRMFTSAARIAADTALVNTVAAATISAGAAAGTLANAKLTTDGVEDGGNTIESTAGSQSKVDAVLSVSDLSKLVSALGVALGSIDVTGGAGNIDKLLIADGVNKNLVASKSSIKTDIDLNNVENKSASTIIGEIDEAALQAADGVTFGSATNLVAKINALSGVLVKAIALDVSAEKIEDKTTSTKLFDDDGNLTFGGLGSVGIKSTTVVTPENIIAAISSGGKAQNLDLGSIGAGNLNDIPETGTDKTVTANEKLGAAYAKTGLNSSGRQTVGLTNKTVAQIENQISARKTLWQDSRDSAGITAFSTITFTSGAGQVFEEQRAIPFMFQTGMTTLYWSTRYYVSAGAGEEVRLKVYDNLGGALLGTGSGVAINSVAAFGSVLECSVNLTLLSLSNDVRYIAVIDLQSTNPNTTTMELAGILEVDFS